MLSFRNILKFATPALFAFGVGLFSVDTAEAAPPTRGYQLQQHLKSGRSTTPSYSRSYTVSPQAAPAPMYARSYVYPYTVPSQYARGPVIVPPVTAPAAPAVTGDATKKTASNPVIVWYEYVPSLGGWVEFRGTLVSGPPASR